MSILVRNNIVTNGLVLYLDAGNKKSYAGSGTVWNNLVNTNITGSLIGEPAYSIDNNGTIYFDKTDDYVSLDSYAENLIFNAPCTIDAWVKPLSNKTVPQTIFNIGDGLTSAQSGDNFFIYYGNVTAGLTNETFTISKWIDGSSSTKTTLYGVVEETEYQNTWVHCCVVISNDTWNIYLNSVKKHLTKSTFNGTRFTYGDSIDPKLRVSIGGSFINSLTEPFHGYFSNFKLYNRALSSSEVLQNYNAHKNRFGLV